MYKAEEEIGENADYLFPELDNLDFEADLDKAFEEIEALHREKNNDDSLEKAVSTEDIASAKSRGLVPQSGNWEKPKRWVRPEDADVSVDTGEKPRKKASEDVPISHLTIDAMKAVFSDDFSMSDFQDMYSIGLDGFSTNIMGLRGRPIGYSKAVEDRSEVTIEVEILDDKENLDEDYEKQPKGIDGHTPLVGTMSRTFTKDRKGILSVSHNRFGLEDTFQGKGIALDIAENVEKHYEKLGVDTITLNANAKIGGYAWARQGYDFEDDGDKFDVVERFKERIGYLLELGDIDYITSYRYKIEIESFKHAWEFASWNPTNDTHGKHLGKEWMLGTTWNAEKTLDKKSQGYQRGKIYFALKRKHDKQG